jgi:molybdopterin-containing oxidoreductase family membrane subunit
MVLTIAIPLRAAYHFEDFITLRHLDVMAKITLVTGLVVAYAYIVEHFMAWYSGDIFELQLVLNRAFGPYAPLYWALLACNVAAAQLLWFKHVRSNLAALFVVALVINVGMWIERFVIVVGSLSRDFLPSAWGVFQPTFWDWSMLLGTLGLFTALMFLFVRLLPAIPAFEMRRLLRDLWGERAAP